MKLVIEIDGGIHANEEVKNNDQLRDVFMESVGLKAVRFTNDEVCKHGETVTERLMKLIESITTTANQ